MSATDDDGDTLTYSLDDQDGAKFEIDSSGQIKTKDALDYEDTPSYSVTVSVTDSEDDAGNAEDPPVEDSTIDVTISVTDVNEPPAFDSNASATQEVAENTAAETNIGDPYTAIDTENDTPLTYSLAGTDAASFAIDTSNGQVKTKDALDHETKASYTVDVQVSDGKDADGNAEDPPVVDTSHTVTITVTDVDEDGTITFSQEDPAAGTALTATLADDDAPISGETWVWEISDDGNTWTDITDATNSSYTPSSDDIGDYLQVTVTYTDTFGSNKTATAATGQVASAPPTNLQPAFATEIDTRSVPENTDAGENIGAPVAVTTDDSVGTLVYSLDATGATSFDIDTATGQLKTKAELDHEDTPSYTVTVSVHDGLDNYENTDTTEDGSIDVTITVTNIDVPAVPDTPTVTAGGAGATAGLTVSWTALTATETEPVDGYDVQYRGKGRQILQRPGLRASRHQRTAPPSPRASPTAPPTKCRCGRGIARARVTGRTAARGKSRSELDVVFSPGIPDR